MKKNLIILSFFMVSLTFAQNNSIDSLLNALKIARHDTSKLSILFSLVETITDDAVWPKYNEQALKLSEKLSQNNNHAISKAGKKGTSDALNNFGFMFNNQGDITKALDHYTRSLKIREEIGDKKGIAISLNNIGVIFRNQGDISKALSYYLKSLKIQEELNNKDGMGTLLNNIGIIYSGQGDIPKALEYQNRGLKLAQEIGDKMGVANSLNHLGNIYYKKNDLPKALSFFERSLKLLEELGDNGAIASRLSNIGGIYLNQNNIQKALDHYQRSLTITRQIGDKDGMTNSLINIGLSYLKQKKYALAFSYTDSSLAIAKKLGYPQLIRNAERAIYQIDAERGNYTGAFDHYKQFIIYRDSINNEGTRKASIKSQLKYEFEKKEAVIKEQQDKERAVAEEKDRFQQIVIWSVVCGLLLVIIFAGFVFRTLKTTRKQKLVIEEKQKEILDSIHYAKRIQKSLLPSEKYIERSLKQGGRN